MAKRSNGLIPTKGQTPVEIFDAASEEITVAQSTHDQIQLFMRGVVAFFQTAKQLEYKARTTLMAAKTLQAPHDAGSDAVVQTIIRRATEESKTIEDHWKPVTSMAHDFHRWTTGGRARGTALLDEAKRIAQPIHNTYVEQERRRVAAENERLRQEQERLAWEQRQRELLELEAQATARQEAAPDLSAREAAFVASVVAGVSPYEAAKKAGYKAPADASVRLMSLPKITAAITAQVEAAALRRQALAAAQQPLQVAEVAEVRPDVATSAGGFDRTTWTGEVLDEKRFIAAVVSGQHQIPTDVLMVNQAKLTEYARALKTHMDRWPGVRSVPTTRTV